MIKADCTSGFCQPGAQVVIGMSSEVGGSQCTCCFPNQTAQQNGEGSVWETPLGWDSSARRVLLSPMSLIVKTLRNSSGSSPIWNPAFCQLKILSEVIKF